MEIFAVILAASIANATSQIFLKLSASNIRWGSIGGVIKSAIQWNLIFAIALFSLSLSLYLHAINQSNISFAFPLMAMSYIFIVFISSVVLRERIDLFRILGTGSIGVGIILMLV